VMWRCSGFSSSWWRGTRLWLWCPTVRHCQDFFWGPTVWEGIDIKTLLMAGNTPCAWELDNLI